MEFCIISHLEPHSRENHNKPEQDCLLQGQAQLDQRVGFRFFSPKVKGSFKKNDKTYGKFRPRNYQ